MQGVHPPESRLHSKVQFDSVQVNSMIALSELEIVGGWEVIEVCGGVVSLGFL